MLLEYIFAAVLHSQFMLHVIPCHILNVFCFDISTFRNMCAVPNMAVSFCSIFFISCFPGTLLRHFPNYLKVDLVAPNITGITLVFTFHMPYISLVSCSVHLKSSPLDKSLGAQRWREV
jgi:hypothetical protein